LALDQYDKIICYDILVEAVTRICGEKHYDLLETLGWDIAQDCFKHPDIRLLTLHIKKPAAIKQAKAGAITLVFSAPSQ
jgi:dihydroneopterin aldolase